MKRRILAAVAALVLAAVGATTLYLYVHRADQRAMAGLQTAQVLVVEKPIAKGTPADQLTRQVASKELPATAIAPGSVTSLDQVKGLVATADLQPGEQVLASRFANAATMTDGQSAPVPKGLQEVSVQLDQQRALGGNIVPGDTVGVFFSIEVEYPNNKANPKDDLTHLTFHRVLVTRVQGGLAPVAHSTDAGSAPAPMPEGQSVMVTLAVTAPQAEKIVFTAEKGSIWLSKENADADPSGAQIVREEGLYQ
ncbi:Flp pilus assembly protein CpaB [Microlunatus ginsengisoli]|uniref:SAF domain-containing protein n=1 Tax=Microlunatus ginsengisoli TaxID=363863 RepID=A0ABP7ASU5_9ACTN